jgi:hypothetical protein
MLTACRALAEDVDARPKIHRQLLHKILFGLAYPHVDSHDRAVDIDSKVFIPRLRQVGI